jgi:hypothetical protein
MKVKLSVAVLAACSALAMAMPVSAQFKGLKAMKKALETATEVLEEPKPTPQPQPPARPTPPRAPAPIAVPVRTQQVTAPATPVVRQAVTNEIVATEAWRCFQEPDATAIKIEFSYLKDPTGQRRGFFTETYASAYDDEGNKLPADIERLSGKGTFTSRGANYQLKFDDPERGVINMAVGIEDPENGFMHSSTRYDDDSPALDDIKSLVQKFSDAEIKKFEMDSDENPDGGMPLVCTLIKPIYSKYSFEDFSVQSPANFEYHRDDIVAPRFTKSEKEFRNVQSIISTIENDSPSFAKFYLVADLSDAWTRDYTLIDARSGKTFSGFLVPDEVVDKVGIQLSSLLYVNSYLHISFSANDEKNSCFINYSVWNGNSLKILNSDELVGIEYCRAEGSASLNAGSIKFIEDQIIRGERPAPTKTAQ